MFAIPEQFSNATKASLESQFALFSSLTQKTFEGVEKLVDLNINAARATLEESSAVARQLLGAKDPQEFFSVSASQAQPAAEKALSYSRQLVDEVSKNAPAGSESFVAAVKTAISNANAGYEQISKTTKQAVEAVEANLNAAVAQFSATARKATNAANAAAAA